MLDDRFSTFANNIEQAIPNLEDKVLLTDQEHRDELSEIEDHSLQNKINLENKKQ